MTEQARAGVAAFVAQARGSAAALLKPRASKGSHKSDAIGEQLVVEELALDFIPPPAPAP